MSSSPSADGVSETAQITWRCWCSTMNVGSRSGSRMVPSSSRCSVCMTPQLNDGPGPGALSTTPSSSASACSKSHSNWNRNDANAKEEEKKDDGNSCNMIYLVVNDDGHRHNNHHESATSRHASDSVVQQCLLALLAVAWKEREHVKQRPEQCNGMDHFINEYNNVAVLVPASTGSLEKLQARAAVCAVPTITTTNNYPTVLALGPAPREQLDMVLPEITYFNWKAADAAPHASDSDSDDCLDRCRVIDKVLTRVLTERDDDTDTAAAAAAAEKKKKLKPNDKCHCGSEKKYKKCCATKDATTPAPAEELQSLGDAVTDLIATTTTYKALSSSASACADATPITDSLLAGDKGGEKVAAYRKQVEYGAKKYIKP